MRGSRAPSKIDAMRLVFAIALAVLLVAAAKPAAAQRALDLQDAVERVQRRTGGRILSAETVRVGRQKHYRVKVLTPEGRVRIVMVPAAGQAAQERKE